MVFNSQRVLSNQGFGKILPDYHAGIGTFAIDAKERAAFTKAIKPFLSTYPH